MHFPRPGFSKPLNICLLATLGLLVALLLINQPLQTVSAPNGIISLQMAASIENTLAILASWGQESQQWAQVSLWLDCLFAVTYVVTLLLLTRHLSRDRPGVRERTVSRGVKALFVSAGASDIAENLILLGNLDTPSDTMSLTATVLALVKFTGLLLGIAGLVVLRAARRHPLTPSE